MVLSDWLGGLHQGVQLLSTHQKQLVLWGDVRLLAYELLQPLHPVGQGRERPDHVCPAKPRTLLTHTWPDHVCPVKPRTLLTHTRPDHVRPVKPITLLRCILMAITNNPEEEKKRKKDSPQTPHTPQKKQQHTNNNNDNKHTTYTQTTTNK